MSSNPIPETKGHDCIDINNAPTGQPCAACASEPIPETDLVKIAEREVLEVGQKWLARTRSRNEPFRFREEDDLYAALGLLEARTAMAATTHLDDERGR